jgi:integrase
VPNKRDASSSGASVELTKPASYGAPGKGVKQAAPGRERDRRKLTLRLVASLPITGEPYRVWDVEVPQLFVRVQPSGIKSYNVQWSRASSKSIGKHPAKLPEAARVTAREILNDADANGTPAAAKSKRAGLTFATFLKERYEPWALAEHKAGAATIANLRAQFGELFDSKPLTAITAWSVEKFKAARLKGGTQPATVNRDLDRIRAALGKAVEWKLLESNPLAGVKRSKGGDVHRVRFLDSAEERRLRKALLDRENERRKQRASGNAWAAERKRDARHAWALDEFTDHLMPLTLLALNTGLRRGELFGLTWEAVRLDGKQLTVTAATAKSRKVRHVPLNAEALDVLRRWKKQGSGVGLVFPGLTGERLTHVNRSWSSLVTAAELTNFHFHDCRHHFASSLVMAGVDLYTVKELLGHRDFETTQRYAHLAPEHKLAAVELLMHQRAIGA